MNVLGIETSCDETAASVVGPDGVRSDVVHTQEIHIAYGGVVPELASRAHADKIVTTVRAALQRAGIDKPDAVAATAGPGLIGAVLVGLCYGKAAAAADGSNVAGSKPSCFDATPICSRTAGNHGAVGGDTATRSTQAARAPSMSSACALAAPR